MDGNVGVGDFAPGSCAEVTRHHGSGAAVVGEVWGYEGAKPIWGERGKMFTKQGLNKSDTAIETTFIKSTYMPNLLLC